jgi:hypothetical protein
MLAALSHAAVNPGLRLLREQRASGCVVDSARSPDLPPGRPRLAFTTKPGQPPSP